MQAFDVVIVGAGFAGLTLALHLPEFLKVLIIERKSQINQLYESTGLITSRTKQIINTFLPQIDDYITNKIDTIGLVAPDFEKHFFSSTNTPWIYTTNTPALVNSMSKKLNRNITLLTQSTFKKITAREKDYIEIEYDKNQKTYRIKTKFLVGADGARSQVARHAKLSQNTKFLYGYEKLFYGDINFGDKPDSTIYHYWFGEFSLGYGGWLSPTIVKGKKAFRIGLAKLQNDMKELKKIDKFIEILRKKNMISIKNKNSCIESYGGYVPLNGILTKIYHDRVLLLGDAGGFCGAFAADGIKGAVVSAKVASGLIVNYLSSFNESVFKQLKTLVNKYDKLIIYYYSQLLYRFVWNQMKRNSTFHAMFDLIERNKDSFISKFCDAKDSGGSLKNIIFKIENLPRVLRYGTLWLRDCLL